MKNKKMNIVAIIPARYASVRFPGKPLVMIRNKPMIQWVYERTKKAIEEVYIATDDERIFNVVKNFGGKVVMTSADHKSGTDRCAEAANFIEKKSGKPIDIVVNVQGDEPFINPQQIKLICQAFDDNKVEIATLAKKITNTEILFDENKVKVVFDNQNFALYFSRSPIPYLRGKEKSSWINYETHFLHVGMYAFRKNTLMKITKLEQTKLEKFESLEQLRWLENNFKIKVLITEYDSFGIDTPEDLEKLNNFLI